MNWPYPVAAIVERGDGGFEAWHFAAVAVVGAGGRVTHSFGDPELTTFTRSAIKPFQALPLCLTGAVDTLGIDAEELALAASSHDGSDQHRAVAGRLLAKAGADAADLQCGAHWPLGMRAADRHPTGGEDRDPLRHNCSGKHAGWLALARVLGVPRGRYLDPQADVQRSVRAAVASACDTDEERLIAGTDGCSAPNYALPLSALARGMLNLATRGPDGAPLHAALARVRAAMQAHPALVSGPSRFDHGLAAAFGDRVVAKGGAEAVQAIGFADPPLGIAVKVLDGGERALPPLSLEVLRQLGLWSGAPPPSLAARVRPVVRNHRGTETGAVVVTPAFQLTARP
jgi:L-asparaginase II